MVRRIRLLSFVVATLSLPNAACMMDDGATGGGAAGGSITVSNYRYQGTDYASASAFFIARLDTSNGSTIDAYNDGWSFDIAMDECLVIEPSETELVPTPIGLDVGSTVTLQTETSSEEIVLIPYSGEGSYTPETSITNPASGKSYSVVIEGTADVDETTWNDALDLPEELDIDELASGSLVLDDQAKTDLTWTSIGADYILFTFPANDGTGYCKVADDGSFGIPGEFAAELVTSSYFTAAGISSSRKTLAGRSVRLVGASGQQAYFSVGAGSPAAN